jgi:hypothetical protein
MRATWIVAAFLLIGALVLTYMASPSVDSLFVERESPGQYPLHDKRPRWSAKHVSKPYRPNKWMGGNAAAISGYDTKMICATATSC